MEWSLPWSRWRSTVAFQTTSSCWNSRKARSFKCWASRARATGAASARQSKEEEEKNVTAKLVVENLKHKPMRSLLSMFLIAVPVTLILCLVGLSRGMLADSARRARGIGADIVIRPPKTSALTLSGAPIPEKLVAAIQSKPHVALAIGMIVHPVSSVSFVSGIDLGAFNRMSGGFKYLEGGPFTGPDDIIVDEYYARQHKLHAGDQVTDVLNRRWRVSGVAEGGKLARLVVPMSTLQYLTGNTGNISQIFVKADKPADIPVVLKELKHISGRL